MKEITLEAFRKLPKKGPYSGNSLNPGAMYYIHDTRKNDNPVYIGTYVKPVYYYNDNNSTSVNYRFENVSYLVKPSNYRNAPGTIFGNVHKYYEIPMEPTSIDIKNKKTTIKELKSFINEKKAEPHDTTPPISFMGKDYRKARDKFYNKSRSSSSSRKSPKLTSQTVSSSLSRKRSNNSSSYRSSSSYRTPSSPRTPTSSSRTSSSFRRRTRRTRRT
jgi:hypothetical protein